MAIMDDAAYQLQSRLLDQYADQQARNFAVQESIAPQRARASGYAWGNRPLGNYNLPADSGGFSRPYQRPAATPQPDVVSPLANRLTRGLGGFDQPGPAQTGQFQGMLRQHGEADRNTNMQSFAVNANGLPVGPDGSPLVPMQQSVRPYVMPDDQVSMISNGQTQYLDPTQSSVGARILSARGQGSGPFASQTPLQYEITPHGTARVVPTMEASGDPSPRQLAAREMGQVNQQRREQGLAPQTLRQHQRENARAEHRVLVHETLRKRLLAMQPPVSNQIAGADLARMFTEQPDVFMKQPGLVEALNSRLLGGSGAMSAPQPENARDQLRDRILKGEITGNIQKKLGISQPQTLQDYSKWSSAEASELMKRVLKKEISSDAAIALAKDSDLSTPSGVKGAASELIRLLTEDKAEKDRWNEKIRNANPYKPPHLNLYK